MMQREQLEREGQQLRARERNLQSMAQSIHCTHREDAEQELERVRSAISLTYVEIRKLGPHALDS